MTTDEALRRSEERRKYAAAILGGLASKTQIMGRNIHGVREELAREACDWADALIDALEQREGEELASALTDDL